MLTSFQELQCSHTALQKRMADFEAMTTAKFEAYEAELAKKDAIIASLRAKIAKLEAELEKYREKDKTNSGNVSMPPSKDKTKTAHKGKTREKSSKKQVAQLGHKGAGLSFKLTTKNMRKLIENNAVTCYANHADYYWQPRCRGRRFCSVAFSCLPFSYLSFIQIIYAVNRQGKRAAQPF